MSSSSAPEVINLADVKRDGREESYSILFDGDGVTGFGLHTDQAGDKPLAQFTIHWSEIRSVIRRSGYLSWGMILETRSGARCEIWVCYEHHPTSFFGKLTESFGDRTVFRAEPAPIWKVVVVPAVLACICVGVGSWVYLGVRDDAGKGELRGIHWITDLFGASGVAALIAFCLLSLVAYSVWLLYREIKIRRRA